MLDWMVQIAACGRGNVHGMFNDTAVDSAGRDRRSGSPAEHVFADYGDEPKSGHFAAIKRFPVRRFRFKCGVAGLDSVAIDRLDGGPIA
jgi:hypothetical protein